MNKFVQILGILFIVGCGSNTVEKPVPPPRDYWKEGYEAAKYVPAEANPWVGTWGSTADRWLSGWIQYKKDTEDRLKMIERIDGK